MAPLYIPVLEYAFSSPRPSGGISKKTFYSLSNLKFDGEGKISTFCHLCCFIHKCNLFKIYNEDEVCGLFTLTFKGRIKSKFEALPTKSIHNWKQFIWFFLASHRYYDYDELCYELENIWRKEGESLEDLFSRFNHICFRFCKDDKPSRQ